jgi:prophage DNA circulation protein
MTWRDDLRRVTIGGRRFVGASFRGVPFLVDRSERTGGRRVVVHEFPLRDDPFVEDMGRKSRGFRVDGYVIGDDYLVQKEALLSALEDETGPGELLHPYHGQKRAICATVSVTETRADGGMATFAIDFTETPAQAPVPTIEVDPAGDVAAGADAAEIAVSAELAELMKPDNLPSFALASAQTALTEAAAALAAKLAPVIAEKQELASFTGQVALMTAEASSLVRQPAEAIGQFLAAITSLVDTSEVAPGAVVDALVAAYAADLGAPAPATTTTRQRELANQLAITGALRRVMAIEAARLVPLVPYASIDEAIATRDAVSGLLDEQAQLAGDTAYPALVDLRTRVLRAVPGGRSFARVVTVARRVATPSLVLAHQLYGSVDQEPDIVARNRIRHPGFLVGSFQVLSDG